MSHRQPERDRHGWNSLQNYKTIHEKCLDECRAYFVEHDTLQFEVISPSRIILSGQIFCHGDLVIYVDKTLERNERNQVRGLRYSYQAQFVSPPLRQIFRYDNSHVYVEEGHEDAFHKHQFSYRTWKDIEPPIWISRQNWPELSKVIDELYEWWIERRDDRLIYP